MYCVTNVCLANITNVRLANVTNVRLDEIHSRQHEQQNMQKA